MTKMSSYDIIKANIEFKDPERIGLRFDRIAKEGDVYRIFVLPQEDRRDSSKTYTVTKKVRPQNGDYDEWGCLWETEDDTGSDMGQVKNIPIDDWSKFDDFQFPDAKAPGRFDGLEAALAEAESRQLYVQLNSPQCIFERMHFLRGFENTLMDILLEPEMIEKLAKKLADYQIGIIEEAYRLGKGRIHCYDTTDDWGTQTSLMISPETWRKIFKPHYKRVIDKAHECKMHVRFHTDGKINDILEDFIELGIDILNIHQPRLVGIDEVSKVAQGKICFEAAVDVQSTLPTGDRNLIEEEVKELVSKWATPNGGLIGIEYGYLKSIGTTKESMLYALECFKKYGQLRKED